MPEVGAADGGADASGGEGFACGTICSVAALGAAEPVVGAWTSPDGGDEPLTKRRLGWRRGTLSFGCPGRKLGPLAISHDVACRVAEHEPQPKDERQWEHLQPLAILPRVSEHRWRNVGIDRIDFAGKRCQEPIVLLERGLFGHACPCAIRLGGSGLTGPELVDGDDALGDLRLRWLEFDRFKNPRCHFNNRRSHDLLQDYSRAIRRIEVGVAGGVGSTLSFGSS